MEERAGRKNITKKAMLEVKGVTFLSETTDISLCGMGLVVLNSPVKFLKQNSQCKVICSELEINATARICYSFSIANKKTKIGVEFSDFFGLGSVSKIFGDLDD